MRRGERYIRQEVWRLEARARCSSFPSLDRPPLLRLPTQPPTTNPAADYQPRRRRTISWSTLSSPFAIRSVPLLLSRPRSHQRTPSGSVILVSRLYSLSYAQLLTRPFSVAFAPCVYPCGGSYPCASCLLRAHRLSSRIYQCNSLLS